MEKLITAQEAKEQSEKNLKEAIEQCEIPQDIIDSINQRVSCGDTEMMYNFIGFDRKLKFKLEELGYKVEYITNPNSVMVIGVKISW